MKQKRAASRQREPSADENLPGEITHNFPGIWEWPLIDAKESEGNRANMQLVWNFKLVDKNDVENITHIFPGNFILHLLRGVGRLVYQPSNQPTQCTGKQQHNQQQQLNHGILVVPSPHHNNQGDMVVATRTTRPGLWEHNFISMRIVFPVKCAQQVGP